MSAPTIPALNDAEILVSQLAYTLVEIKTHSTLEWFSAQDLQDALDAALDCHHHLTTLQMRLKRR